jgi:hypothetical protein
MLHHLATSEKAWQSCPLCDDFVYERDLRSVRWKLVTPPTVGARVAMKLLKRERGTTLPLTAADWAAAPPHIRSAPTAMLTASGIEKDYFKIIPVRASDPPPPPHTHTTTTNNHHHQ